MLDYLEQLGRFLRLLIPSNMFHGRDAEDQIVFLLREKVRNILVDDARTDFIFVHDIMVNGKIV